VLRRIVVLGVALAVALAAAASAASAGLYTGKTSQKLQISVKVSGGKVVKVSYTASNKFSATVHPDSETVDKLSGGFKGQRVTGTLDSTVTEGGIHTTTCHSGKLTFSAKL
jgi:phosphate-selective porin